MKSSSLIIIFCIFSGHLSISQETDSSCVKQFFDKSEYPEIDTVFYHKKYKFGKLSEEGWRVLEIISPSSKIITGTDSTKSYVGTYNLGVWKFYSHGKLSRIDTNSFEDQKFVSKEYYYWKNKNIRYYFYSKVDYNSEKGPKFKTGSVNDTKYPGDEIRLYYNRKGILKKKYVWKNDEFIEEVEY